MCNTLFPNDEELNFRKEHCECDLGVLNVLNNDICCAICHSDLKKDILLNEDIMLHGIFLCLCCEKCFAELSNSENGCIFCSQNVQLKTCEICYSKMCQRCINNYCSTSEDTKTLKSCLNCSTNALWIHRYQAAAVLKCFSFELNIRLILSGKETSNKQTLSEFILSSSKSSDITPNDINKIRVNYLCFLLCKAIDQAFINYQKLLLSQNINQCIEHFTELCGTILKSTCGILTDFKYLLNKDMDSSYTKVESLLRRSTLFNISENNCDKLSIMEKSGNLAANINSLLNCTNEMNEAELNQKNGKNISQQTLEELKEFELVCETIDVSHESSSNIKLICESIRPRINLFKCNQKNINNENDNKLNLEVNEDTVNLNTESNTKIKYASKELTTETNDSFFEGSFKKFSDYDPFQGLYEFKVLNDDTMICETIDTKKLVCETVNVSSEFSSNNELNYKSFQPEINLTSCDQKNINNENENKLNEEVDDETVKFNTESSTKINSVCEELTDISVIGTVHRNIETVNSFFEEKFKYFSEFDPFEGRYIFKTLDDDTMICEAIDTEKMDDETVNVNTESNSLINSVRESVWPKVYITKCDQKDVANENQNKLNKEVDDSTVNLNTESNSLINSVRESVWPKVYLTKCDQKDVANENENKLNKEVDDATLNFNPESSSFINSDHKNVWPKVYLTKCDQKDVANENENKLNKEVDDATLNFNSESSSFINSDHKNVWPQVYSTKCDQKDIDDENKIDSKPTRMTRKRKLQVKCDQKDIDDENKIDSKQTRMTRKRKFLVKPHHERIYSKIKKFKKKKKCSKKSVKSKSRKNLKK